MSFFRQEEANSSEINQLRSLAARAEATRLGDGARRRILDEAASEPARSWMPRLAGLQWAAAMGLLALLVAPAAFVREGGTYSEPSSYADSMNLEVNLQDDGSVLLEWENGKAVHTVRRATSPVDVADAKPIRVEGSSFTDSDPSGAEIVYYQVD